MRSTINNPNHTYPHVYVSVPAMSESVCLSMWLLLLLTSCLNNFYNAFPYGWVLFKINTYIKIGKSYCIVLIYCACKCLLCCLCCLPHSNPTSPLSILLRLYRDSMKQSLPNCQSFRACLSGRNPHLSACVYGVVWRVKFKCKLRINRYTPHIKNRHQEYGLKMV